MQPILIIKNLRKEYDEFLLDNISLDIPQGNITGIIGPNGSGKTTTIKLIMNLIQADQGEVTIFNQDSSLNSKEIKNRIGYIGEEQPFYDHRSAAWTGKFVSHFFDKWDMDTFNNLMELFELPRKKRIKHFSKGMRVKLALAVALSHNAELIILDEPTSGLDPIVRREVLDLLRKITVEENKTVIISSHITDDLERIADYIAYMLDGKITLFKEKDELLSNWKKIHFKKDSLDQNIIDSLEKVETHTFGSSGVTRNYGEIKAALSEGISRDEIKLENIGLDDILISLAKGE